MKTFLFACIHNAGRSQMAAALFNRLADPAKARGVSAGTSPASHVHPEVVEVMRELGVDLGGSLPRLLDDGLARTADTLVTMGCEESCPFVPGLRVIGWSLPDPKGQTPERVREIREEIGRLVRGLVESEGLSARTLA